MEKIAEPDELQKEFSKRVPSLILASSSPNRKALLERAGTVVTTFSPDIDESRDNSDPIESIKEIVKRKFASYKNSLSYRPDVIAIAADTLVLKDNKLIGKPKDAKEAKEILRSLSAGEQKVLTAVALHIPDKEDIFFVDSATVVFKKLSEDDIECYISKDEWIGAAGGYRLQMTGYELVDSIDGDWTCVVGLPLKAILEHISS